MINYILSLLMTMMTLSSLVLVATLVALAVGWVVHRNSSSSRLNVLQRLAGPPVRLFGNHMSFVLSPSRSPKVHDLFVRRYGRSVRIRGPLWDYRLLPLDPLSVSHVLKNSTIYEKPRQSRRLIASLIGCGMLAAEGHVHKRQRRVATPAFSIQNLRALVPLVFRKGNELQDKWSELLHKSPAGEEGIEIDICHWIGRATFDVIGLAGFDYHFNAIQNESDELFTAYKEMFETTLSLQNEFRIVLWIFFPILRALFPDAGTKIVQRSHSVINRVAGELIQSKKARIMEGRDNDTPHTPKDLLSLLLKSNLATDLPPNQRISDEDILHNINTFIFAGTDTTSLALTWTLLLLARHPEVQTRLRAQLQEIAPPTPSSRMTAEEIGSLHVALSDHPYLENVVRESLRLIPPIHSSLRVATQDDEIPTLYPVRLCDGSVSDQRFVHIRKGEFVHIPIEALHLDKETWGENAWEFDPERWDHLPEAVGALPGLYSNLLAFSAGPRSCIGMRFSMIEMKTFLYILLTNFIFAETEKKIFKANVALTRPYVVDQLQQGSQCPLLVKKVGS